MKDLGRRKSVMKPAVVRMSVWLLTGSFLLTLGCGPTGPDRPRTFPVSGVVTYSGKPVEGANLNFQLTDGSGYAMAITDASGRYTLMTFVAGDGALPGEYHVGITKYEQSVVTGSTSDDDDYIPPEEQEFVPPPANQLPMKYSVPQTSGLTATVKEEPNTFNWELVD
jgi:hypothetical protein